MIWLLLKQHFVHTQSESYRMSVLEEVLSSELQLVQVLASGLVSLETMTSHGHGQELCSLEEDIKESRM